MGEYGQSASIKCCVWRLRAVLNLFSKFALAFLVFFFLKSEREPRGRAIRLSLLARVVSPAHCTLALLCPFTAP